MTEENAQSAKMCLPFGGNLIPGGAWSLDHMETLTNIGVGVSKGTETE
jgi:hypothetical protein